MSVIFSSMYPNELKKLWNDVKKDYKSHPEEYTGLHLTFWEIGQQKRLRKAVEEAVILTKVPRKGVPPNHLQRCEECDGEGRLILASAYSIIKNNRTYSKIKKEWGICEDCNGAGYVV